MAHLACTPVTAGLFDAPKKLFPPSQHRAGPSVSSRCVSTQSLTILVSTSHRDVSSPAFVGKFGQKPMLRFPDNNGKPSTGTFVRPDMAEGSDAPRGAVRTANSAGADFGMATPGDRANTKGIPVRSALEHASQLSNDVLWTDFDTATPKQRRK